MIDKIPNEKLILLFRQCDELAQTYGEVYSWIINLLSQLKLLRQKKEDNKEVLNFFKENRFANGNLYLHPYPQDKHLLVNVGSHFLKSNKAEAFSFTERCNFYLSKSYQ